MAKPLMRESNSLELASQDIQAAPAVIGAGANGGMMMNAVSVGVLSVEVGDAGLQVCSLTSASAS